MNTSSSLSFSYPFYEIALFIEVELVIGLHADMLVETVQSADAECALGEVGLGGQAVFNADLIPFQLGVGIINVVFQDGRERSGSDVVHQIEKVADERTLEQGVLRFIGRACPWCWGFCYCRRYPGCVPNSPSPRKLVVPQLFLNEN